MDAENFQLTDQRKDGTFEKERVCQFSEENINPILIREIVDSGNGGPWGGDFQPLWGKTPCSVAEGSFSVNIFQ